MANYRKMYAVLCAAVDEVIDPLEKSCSQRLRQGSCARQ